MKYITLLIAIITLTGCSQQLGSLPVVEDSKVTVIELSTTEKISKDGIEKVLKDKTQVEKVNLKSKELAKVKLGKFKKDNLDIEIIGDIKEIDGGIQIFAKAWKDGKQLGFGKDGTVEIERFRFFNPPVLVDDENGEIVRESIDGKTKELVKRKLKYDPEEAIKQILEDIILQVGKDGKNIIIGKVGNTTSTFYPVPGTTVDGRVYRFNTDTTWTGARDTTAGTGASYADTTEYGFCCASTNAGKYSVFRWFFLFTTSAIDTDDISSATLSIYKASGAPVNTDTTSGVVVDANPASNTALATGDFDAYTNTSGGSEALADWTTGAGFINFTLDTTGRGFIDKTGITKLAVINSLDLDNTAPTGGNEFGPITLSDATGTTNDPKLVVEHSEAVSRRIINIE